jgi:hypothetical protein
LPGVGELTTHPVGTGESFTWMAHPDEPLQRSSTALAVDGGWILVDPVDHPGLEARLAARPVLGVCSLLNRHSRDAGELSARLGVPLMAPAVLAGSGVPLRHDDIEERVVLAAPGWNESALWVAGQGLLVCADALGTIGYFLASDEERIGVHPLLRPRPPAGALGGLDPSAVAVGHGPPLTEDAPAAMEHALASARRLLPKAWGRAAAQSLGSLAGRVRARA